MSKFLLWNSIGILLCLLNFICFIYSGAFSNLIITLILICVISNNLKRI